MQFLAFAFMTEAAQRVRVYKIGLVANEVLGLILSHYPLVCDIYGAKSL